MAQAAVKDATARAQASASEARRLASELASAQKAYAELRSRIANMNAISAKAAKAAAEERAAAEQRLVAEEQAVASLKVHTPFRIPRFVQLCHLKQTCALSLSPLLSVITSCFANENPISDTNPLLWNPCPRHVIQ